MRKRVLLALGVWLFTWTARGTADDRWTAITELAYNAFNPDLGIQTRYTNATRLLQRLYTPEGVRVVYVDARANGFGDGSSWLSAFHTIGEALGALDAEGGWVWVAEGTYRENLHVKSKTCLFGGFSGVETSWEDRDIRNHPAMLEGDGTQSVVFLEHQTMLDGFTVTGGGGERGGGAVMGGWLSIVRNNIFRDNIVTGWGSGGGLMVMGGGYSDGSLGIVNGMAPIIERNVFWHNTGNCGSGLAIRFTPALFVNNTVVNNIGGIDRPARGIEIGCWRGNEPAIVNSIFWGNDDDVYHLYGTEGIAILKNNCTKDVDVDGDGMIHGYPAFADSAAGDFSLLRASPCIDAGVLHAFPDPDGTTADLGAVFTPPLSNPFGGAVTLLSSPLSGIPIRIHGLFLKTPATVSWYPGTEHGVLPAQAVRLGQGAAWVFSGWSDGIARRERVIVSAQTPVSYTAVYRNQVLLDVQDAPPGITIPGSGWHDPNSTVRVSAPEIMDAGGGIRYRFTGWQGMGPGSYTGPDTGFTVVLTQPIQEKLSVRKQVRLDATFFPKAAGLSILTEPPGIWQDAGTTVALEAVSVNPKYRFSQWWADGWKKDKRIELRMDAPRSVTAVFDSMPHPPFVVRHFPDTTLAEDGELALPLAGLQSLADDAVDPSWTLAVAFGDNPNILCLRDPILNAVRLVPAADWSGIATLVVTLTDPTGAADRDTFSVTVAPVPDPPEPFDLLSPEPGAGISIDHGPVVFSWNETTDPDPADTIAYRFLLGADEADLAGSAVIDTTVGATAVSVRPPFGNGYFWNVEAVDRQGNRTRATGPRRISLLSGVERGAAGAGVPRRYGFGEGFPNPFNPDIAFTLDLPAASIVRAAVYDVRGRRVAVLADGIERAGSRRVSWNGRDDSGLAVPSGIYTVRAELGGRVFLRKCVLAK
jgi:hypothetical protein